MRKTPPMGILLLLLSTGCASPAPAILDQITVNEQVVAQSQPSLQAQVDAQHQAEHFGSDGWTQEHGYLAWCGVLALVIGIPGWMGFKVWWKGRNGASP